MEASQWRYHSTHSYQTHGLVLFLIAFIPNRADAKVVNFLRESHAICRPPARTTLRDEVHTMNMENVVVSSGRAKPDAECSTIGLL